MYFLVTYIDFSIKYKLLVGNNLNYKSNIVYRPLNLEDIDIGNLVFNLNKQDLPYHSLF